MLRRISAPRMVCGDDHPRARDRARTATADQPQQSEATRRSGFPTDGDHRSWGQRSRWKPGASDHQERLPSYLTHPAARVRRLPCRGLPVSGGGGSARRKLGALSPLEFAPSCGSVRRAFLGVVGYRLDISAAERVQVSSVCGESPRIQRCVADDCRLVRSWLANAVPVEFGHNCILSPPVPLMLRRGTKSQPGEGASPWRAGGLRR